MKPRILQLKENGSYLDNEHRLFCEDCKRSEDYICARCYRDYVVECEQQ